MNIEQSTACAFEDTELACFYTVQYVLGTHDKLNKNDILFGSNYIASLYYYNKNFDALIQFLTYANKNTVCEFALLYNMQLDQAIKKQNTTLLKSLFLSSRDSFVEIFDNPHLSQTDLSYLLHLLQLCLQASVLFFETMKQHIIYYTDPTCRCNINQLNMLCKQNSCFQQPQQIEAIFTFYESLPDNIFMIDKPPGASTFYVYTFNPRQLLDILAIPSPAPINPKTNARFHPYALKLIYQRWPKELAMYRRYKELIANQ